MWQQLRDYWLPLMLFVGAVLVAVALLTVVMALPYLADRLPFAHPVLTMFATDATVRRSAIAGAIGLIVTAFVFFRPKGSVLPRKMAPKMPPHDTMAGA